MIDPYPLARPLLFALDPERAHELTLATIDAAACTGALRALAGAAVDDPVEVMGLKFANRVGLAAGLDKNGAHVDAFAAMGFGFVEVGTVTPRAQPGNPRPRLFRLPRAKALINRMGFNNDGVDAFVRNVRGARYDGVLGLNIGKNADTPIERASDDYLHCLERVYPHASYVTVNVSSPNTKNLRELQGADALDAMLGALRERQQRLADTHARYVPLALKIAPDLAAEQIESIAQILLHHRIDAVIATNTTLSREGLEGLPHATESGGLSGAPLTARAQRVMAALARQLDRRIPLVGAGGIMSGADAAARVAAGATLVQLYTGLVYAGPGLIKECRQALARHA